MKSLVRALVALTLVAQAAQTAHFALVEHTVCAEHGELVHRTHGEDRDTHHHDEALTLAEPPRTLSSDATLASEAHDHCVALSAQRHTELTQRIDSLLVAPSVMPPPIVVAYHVVIADDPLDVAPKSSPPTV